MKMALTLRDLHKRYGKVHALNRLTLEIPQGVICGLVGPNGAGKTTAYGVISGCIRPDSGTVDILGDGPFSVNKHRGRLSLLPQDCALNPHVPVRNLLIHFARLQGLGARDANQDADRVLDLVSLTDKATQKIRALSHGMRRRLAVAQALLGQPELVLLDEPTSGLDPEQVVRLRDVFSAQRGKRTLVISSHILSELEACCDHVVVMEAGKCVQHGPMDQITQRGAQITISLSDPPPMDTLALAMPEVSFQCIDNMLTAIAPATVTGAELTRGILPVLLESKVDVLEIRRGTSLEEAFMSTRRLNTDSGV